MSEEYIYFYAVYMIYQIIFNVRCVIRIERKERELQANGLLVKRREAHRWAPSVLSEAFVRA